MSISLKHHLLFSSHTLATRMLRCTHVANVSFLNLLAVLLVNGLTGKRVDKLQKKVVLYSSGNEYYTQVAMSTMLKCG